VRFALNYVFTQKELSFLDDILPGMRQTKRKLSLKDVDVELLEQSTKTSKSDAETKYYSNKSKNANILSVDEIKSQVTK
jgi:tRNA A-37 threonylcarbamoyl transferase component Bud32